MRAARHNLAFDRALSSAGLSRDVIGFDRMTLRRFDVDGRMHVERCNISKANVCPYFGREIPNGDALGLEPEKIYYLYRDPEELRAAAGTFKNLQLLMLHKAVNAENPETEITVGTVGSDVEYTHPYLTASLAVWTAEAIALIDSKKQAELSCSYRYRADMTPGRTPEGVAFDGVMRDIMGNHVALVEKGRAGPDVVVSDSLPREISTMYKRPKLLTAVLAALGPTLLAAPTDEQKLAIDAALVDAEDADLTEEEKAAKKKAAEDEAAGVSPGPKMGERGAALDAAAMDAAIVSKGYITADAAQKLANDAANAAVARVNALHKARKDVEPLVGVVAFDSAEEVYAFALKQAGVTFDGVPAAAYGALVEQVRARKTAAPANPVPKFASDAANAAAGAMPVLGRFSHG